MVVDVSHEDQEENASQDKMPALGETSQPEAGSDSEHYSELEAREQELTREVPHLMDSMNRASTDVNVLESQAVEAQKRYKQLLEQWSRLYEDLRVQYGSSIDKARPYFDAAQALSSASQHVQGVVREFSSAVSQHTQAKQDLRAIEERLAYGAHKVVLDKEQQSNLSSATVRVLRCQQERDKSEQEYAKALREYQDAQETAEAKRAQVGDSAIRRALPCFRQLQHHQQELDREQRRLSELNERIKTAKSTYHSSMRGLDKISVAVHNARRDFKEQRENSSSPSKCSNRIPQPVEDGCAESSSAQEASAEETSPSSALARPIDSAKEEPREEEESSQDADQQGREANEEVVTATAPLTSESRVDVEDASTEGKSPSIALAVPPGSSKEEPHEEEEETSQDADQLGREAIEEVAPAIAPLTSDDRVDVEDLAKNQSSEGYDPKKVESFQSLSPRAAG